MKKKFRHIRVCNRDWTWRARGKWLKVWDVNKRVVFEGLVKLDDWQIHTHPKDVAKTIKDYLIANGELDTSDHFLELL